MTTAPQKRDIVVSRVLDAPVEQVWKVWSDPEDVKRWWGPQGYTCPVARMDFREGGPPLHFFEARNGGTDLRAVHDGLPPGLSPADNELGWRVAFANLGALVEGRSRTRSPEPGQ